MSHALVRALRYHHRRRKKKHTNGPRLRGLTFIDAGRGEREKKKGGKKDDAAKILPAFHHDVHKMPNGGRGREEKERIRMTFLSSLLRPVFPSAALEQGGKEKEKRTKEG